MKYKGVSVDFGAYLPDQPFFGEGLESACQLVYMDGAYQRVPGMTGVTGATPAADILNNALWAHDESGSRLYVATSGHLWEVNTTTGAITDRCKAGPPYATGDWSLLKFGDNVIAEHSLVPMQTIAPGAAAVDLCTSTTKPQGKYLCACRGHVILANISSPAAKPREFRWSGRFDPGNWEPGSNRSGFGELFTDAGIITGCAGFEDFWLLFTSTGVFRASYIGGDAVWSLQQIGHLHDAMPRGMFRSVVAVGRDAHYISRTGPKVVVNGESVVDTAAGKVRRAMTDINRSNLTDTAIPAGYIPFNSSPIIVSGIADSLRRVVIWSWAWQNSGDAYLVSWIYSVDDGAWSTMYSAPLPTGTYLSPLLVSREYGASLVAGAAGPLRGSSMIYSNSLGTVLKLLHFEDDAANRAATLIRKPVEVGPSSTGLHAVRLRARFVSMTAAPALPEYTITVSGYFNLPVDPSDTPDVTATLVSTGTGVDARGFIWVPGGPLRAAYLVFKVTCVEGGAQVRDLSGLDLLLDPDKSER